MTICINNIDEIAVATDAVLNRENMMTKRMDL